MRIDCLATPFQKVTAEHRWHMKKCKGKAIELGAPDSAREAPRHFSMEPLLLAPASERTALPARQQGPRDWPKLDERHV
jgi:hypothetical protein